jgi:hypothetical protein
MNINQRNKHLYEVNKTYSIVSLEVFTKALNDDYRLVKSSQCAKLRRIKKKKKEENRSIF